MTRLIHQFLMYDTEKDILDTVVPFLQEGLSAGEAVLAVGTAPNLSCLRQALGTDSDAVEFADSACWYVQPTRTIANYSSFIAENATARIRVVAEPGWDTGTPAQISEWMRYESIINQAFADISASVLCLYDRRTHRSRPARRRAAHPSRDRRRLLPPLQRRLPRPGERPRARRP